MKIKVNEIYREISNASLYEVREMYKKDADVIILNGFPVVKNRELKDGDKVVLIKKGELYKKEELEILMAARHTPGVHSRVKKAKVVICGAGGLGSTIATELCRIGVGNIKIIDFDIVEPSNLNRQQYFIEDIGEFKVEALKKTLRKINPFIKIDTSKEKIKEDNVSEVLEGYEIVIEAFDKADYKAMLTNFVLSKTKAKLICGSGMAGFYDSNSIKTKRIMDRLYVCGDLEKEAKEGEGLMAPRVSICGSHMANMALRLILGEE